MNSEERRATFGLAIIFAFRMLGLFMILPVFSLYAEQLPGATHELIGIAIGIYGLTQAFLQIPFGTLSDYWGRKPIITIGLSLFALGSIIAALSHTIIDIIVGRALQGAGAVGSTIMAFVADLTRDENRTKAMGTIGLVIGFSFSFAMVMGPILQGWFDVPGIFWLSGLLAIAAIVILFTLVPRASSITFHADAEAEPGQILAVLCDKQLLRLNTGIFFQHAILTAIFIAIPIILTRLLSISISKQWIIYLPILFLSLFITVPLIIISEKKRLLKPFFIGAIGVIVLTQLSLAFAYGSLIAVNISLLLFFSAFNFLEASLPSLISKLAPINNKGTAMGIYSSSQFLGIFCGGLLGGWLYGRYHISGVFVGCVIMAVCWLLTAVTMQKVRYVSTKVFKLPKDKSHQAQLLAQLENLDGIEEISLISAEDVIHIKVDTAIISYEKLKSLISGEKNG